MLQLFGNAISQVLIGAIVFGAGLPALFAVGIRSMAVAAGGTAETSHANPKPAMKVVGYLCFAVVLLGIALGLAIILSSGFGYQVSFQHGFPTFVKK